MRKLSPLALLILIFSLGASAQSPATSACQAVSTGDYAPLNGWVPAPNDAWHQDISAAPVDPSSNTIMTTSGDLVDRYLHADFTIPYTVVDGSTRPADGWAVPVAYIGGDSDMTLYPIDATTLIEGQPGQCWNDAYDHHAIILDKNSCVVYEIYNANLCNGSWTSYQNTVWDLSETELRPYGTTSADAAGLSLFEGLVRYDEIVAGAINHAIRFTASHTKADNANGYFTAPATHAAGNLWGTDNIIGMRIRLKADYDISSFSPTNQIILTAMKKYGMILADNGSDMFFQGTPDSRWNGDDLSILKNVPSSAFDVVQMAPVYDSNTAPQGPAPVINSFTASSSSVSSGTSIVLTPDVTGGSYMYVQEAGFTRGPMTLTPNQTTTYTLVARNQFGTTSATTTVNVDQTSGRPTLTFAPIPSKVLNDAPFTVSATSPSPGAITYSIVSGPATIAGKTISITGIGSIIVQASQAASGAFTTATATASVTVNGIPPTINFTQIADMPYTTTPFTVSATSNSSGAMTYSLQSGPAVLSGNTVTPNGSGRVTLMASQAAGGNYAAGTATMSFNIIGTSPTLALNAVPAQTVGNSFPISATSNSPGSISYSVASGFATITNGIVTVTAVGPVTLMASQAASGQYSAATTSMTLSIGGAATGFAFAPIASQVYPEPSFMVSASSPWSFGVITYTVVSGPATVAGNMVTLTGTGTVTLKASQMAWAQFAAATVTASFAVTPASPTTLAFAPIANQTYGVNPFAVHATSNSPGAITYSVTSGPATIAGSMLTVTGVGTVVLGANQAASGGYPVMTATTGFSVGAETPTLAFTTVPNQTYGVGPFAVTATSNSTAAISYTVVGGPATIAGNMVTLTGAGPVSLKASQAAAGNFTAGTATTGFTVNAETPTLTLTPIANQPYSTTPIALSATSNSTGTITYSVVTGPATVSGHMVTLTGAGSVTIEANQVAAGGYSSATATQSFTSGAIAPALAFAPIPTQSSSAPPFALTATSNSTGAITYSVVSGPATIAGNTVTLTGSGTVTLKASQAAAGGYSSAMASMSFSVSASAPSLSFAPVTNQSYGAAPFPVSATSNSTGAITYSVVSGPATIAGNVVTVNGTGTVTLKASQAAAGSFSTATTTISFNVNSVTPTLSFIAVSNKTYSTALFTVGATSNSMGAITYSVVSGPATIAGNTVTLTGSGTVTLMASQAAAGGYSADTAQTSFMVNATTPTLAITPIANKTFGVTPFAVAATSNSTAAITYSVASGPAQIAGNVVTLTGAGTVTIQASQVASAPYAAATAAASFVVTSETTTLNFAPVANRTFSTTPFNVSATSNSPGEITYSVVSGPANLSGNSVTLTAPGTVTIQAFQVASGGYASATGYVSFVVSPITTTLSFAPVANRTFSTTPFAVSATSNSPATIAYSVASGPASLAGSSVTLTGSGTVTLMASQAASGGYASATANVSFTVTPITPTLSFAPVNQQSYGAPPFAVSAASNSTAAVTYTVVSGPATIAGNIVTVNGVGTVTLQASQPTATGYSNATTLTSFQVQAPANTLAFTPIANLTYGVAPFAVSASSDSPAAITYIVTSGPATIAGNTLTVTSAGLVTLQAKQAASGVYPAGSASASFGVAAAMPTLTFTTIANQNANAAPFAVAATSNSTGAIIYSIVSGPATIASNIVTLTGSGPVTVEASQAASGAYSATSTTTSFTVNPSTVSAVADFSIPSSVPAVPVTPGRSNNVAVAVTSLNGFTGIVALNCSLPTGMASATCTATSTQVGPTAPGKSMITIATSMPSGTVVHLAMVKNGRRAIYAAMLLPLAFPLFSRKRRRLAVTLAMLALAAVMGTGLTGCANGILGIATPAGTFTANVIATSGKITHTMTFNVEVQ